MVNSCSCIHTLSHCWQTEEFYYMSYPILGMHIDIFLAVSFILYRLFTLYPIDFLRISLCMHSYDSKKRI